ncbi:MAG: (2Fe-2S)-binding protein [Candidatus Thermoplasmatota archaeon]|nr:(2Fe-2S)-binding protein [Candidatus Thermoplasmatota archaeon]
MMKSVKGKRVAESAEYEKAVSRDRSNADKYCLVCGTKGTKVFPTTMRNHVDVRYWSLVDDTYRFSPEPDCNVIYYSNADGLYFFNDEVKTPYALKEMASPRPVCYCMGVTEEEIKTEILSKGCCDSLEDIEEYTRAGTGKWCFVTNPSGKCCREYLPGIVDKFLKQVKEPHLRLKLTDVANRLSGSGDDFVDVALRVEGMTCESCATTVRATLESIGAESPSVSLKDKKATARIPKTLRPEDVAKAVSDAGYESSVMGG